MIIRINKVKTYLFKVNNEHFNYQIYRKENNIRLGKIHWDLIKVRYRAFSECFSLIEKIKEISEEASVEIELDTIEFLTENRFVDKIDIDVENKILIGLESNIKLLNNLRVDLLKELYLRTD